MGRGDGLSCSPVRNGHVTRAHEQISHRRFDKADTCTASNTSPPGQVTACADSHLAVGVEGYCSSARASRLKVAAWAAESALPDCAATWFW
jgi:hypothetical protein